MSTSNVPQSTGTASSVLTQPQNQTSINAVAAQALMRSTVPGSVQAAAPVIQALTKQKDQSTINAIAGQVIMIPLAAMPAQSTATFTSILTQQPNQSEINAVAAQVVIKSTLSGNMKVAAPVLQVLTRLVPVQPVYNTKLEALGAGFMPATDSGVSLEVLAAIPFNANDYNVRMEVLGVSTVTPQAPSTTVVWFTS